MVSSNGRHFFILSAWYGYTAHVDQIIITVPLRSRSWKGRSIFSIHIITPTPPAQYSHLPAPQFWWAQMADNIAILLILTKLSSPYPSGVGPGKAVRPLASSFQPPHPHADPHPHPRINTVNWQPLNYGELKLRTSFILSAWYGHTTHFDHIIITVPPWVSIGKAVWRLASPFQPPHPRTPDQYSQLRASQFWWAQTADIVYFIGLVWLYYSSPHIILTLHLRSRWLNRSHSDIGIWTDS